jgi:SpoVK/Ycf46/Vps4 family AAA+-type ATPase
MWLDDGAADVRALATQFRFHPGQIRRAAELARRHSEGRPAPDDLLRACREQTHLEVSALARKVESRADWDDLVLPKDRKMQLGELCDHVRNRGLVYDIWGLGASIPYGRGLNALFSGPPGTGKTMAASIVAGELGLDLYRIDLAGIVNKYIGETEKNLAKVFAQADGANLVLFFDEADALFVKRTEIRDSHDRFANIEIGYLLQKLEEHEGVVILATNLRRNLDDAFLRRFQYTVEFPLPSEKERLLLWQRIWPEGIRLDAAIGAEGLARQYELSGGAIRDIAVTAAFLAAADSGVVRPAHIARAVQREYQKMGKIVMDNGA